MYRSIISPCCVPGTNLVLLVNYTSKTNKPIEKEIRFVVTRGRGWEEGELDEGGQKVTTCSYKISTRDVTYNMINIINTAV